MRAIEQTMALGTAAALQTLEPEPFLAALVKGSDDAVIGTSCDGIVVFWNAGAERLFGYRAEEMLGREVAVLTPPDRTWELADLLSRARSGESVRNLRTERVRKDESFVAVSITATPVVNAEGEVIGISKVARDMTLQNRQIADLLETHRQADKTLSMLETLQASAPIGLGFVDSEFRHVHLNEGLAAFVGVPVEQLIGRTLEESIPEVWKLVETYFHDVLQFGAAVLNVEVACELAADPGRQHHWLASYYPVRLNSEVIGIGIVALDITELRHAEEFRSIVMNNMAEGLFTLDSGGRLTSINDAAANMLGWTEEELLGRETRSLILSQGKAGDKIDEGDRELLKVRAEGKHVQLDDHAFLCKNGSLLSVSVSASPLFIGTSIEGAVVVFRDITEKISDRLRVTRELEALSWVGRIRDALDEDRLVLYSQPIVPLRGGRQKEELLLRMLGRKGELIGPSAFLGVAEKYGLITEIDQWVVKQAVRLAASGRHVGVNVSAESATNLDLLSLIDAEMRTTGADPSNLVLELTETALMRDIEKTREFVRGVVDLGCAIALDDFGTGFGTFTHVKELDVRYLKIDLEFVRDLVGNSANQHVVKAIVNLAQGFGCQTIAEGVEDAEALELLKDFQVDYAQGFFIGRPAPL